MFMLDVNAACNNNMFNTATISAMHESMTRLYAAAHKVKGKKLSPSDLARALAESPQRIHNWESRGISKEGALKAQQEFNCNANWLLGTSGDAYIIPAPESPQNAMAVHEPSPVYWPFELVDRQRYHTLSLAAQHAAQLRMMDEVKAQEAEAKTNIRFAT